MFLDEGDEIRRRVASQRGFREVRIGGDKISGAALKIREVTAAATGDQDFLSGPLGPLEYGDAPAALSGFDGAQQSSGACAENYGVELLDDRGQASKPGRTAGYYCSESPGNGYFAGQS